MIERISQSFIKSMREYVAGEECGLVIKHQYVDGHLIDRKSKEMAEGSYFEYMLSGALPKNGVVPPRLMQKSGKEPLMDYKRAEVNAERVKAYLVELGLKIIHVGKKYTKGRHEGTIDLVCECQRDVIFNDGTEWHIGDKIVLDVKYSGLLHDKWEKHGWQWSNIQKEYHGTQAKEYHYITGLPFYFLVVSNTNLEKENEEGVKEFLPTDLKLFHVPVDQHMIDQHLSEGNALYDKLKFESEMNGLTPRPSLVRCNKCPIREGCNDKHIFPHVEKVDLTIGV